MSRHVEEKNATSLAPSKADPKANRFENSLDVGEAGKAAVAKTTRTGKGMALQSPRIVRRKVSQQKRKGVKVSVVRREVFEQTGVSDKSIRRPPKVVIDLSQKH